MAQCQFFTNHMHVLKTLAEQPDLRLREIAREVGITERATHRIISELVDDGYLTRTRVGARNRYEVHEDRVPGVPGEPARERATPSDADMFRAVFAAAPAGMVVTDVSGTLLRVNQAFCDIVRRPPEELVGRHFVEITHPEDRATGEQGFGEVATGERSEYVREKRYVRPDGSSVWVKLRAAAMAAAGTGPRLIIAHVVDISERKRQDEVLAEAEERFRSAFDNAPIGMALVAPDGRWLKVNRSVCELTGYAETELLMRSFQSITHPEDLDADLAQLEEVLAGRRRTYQMEKRYWHADGHLIWVMLSVSLVRDASGEPLYLISQIEDITERKDRERALRKQAAGGRRGGATPDPRPAPARPSATAATTAR